MRSSFLALLAGCVLCLSVSCERDVPNQNNTAAQDYQEARNATTETAHDLPNQESQSEGKPITVEAGYYGLGHPGETAVNEFLARSTVAVWLSWHNGISLESDSGEGWDDNLTLDELKSRLEKTVDRTQAAIVLEKNFTGDDKEDEAVAEILKQIGFKTIVLQSCHSSAIVIDKRIENEQ